MQYAKIKNGHPCESVVMGESGTFRLYYNNRFLGIAISQDDGFIKPLRLCNTANR